MNSTISIDCLVESTKEYTFVWKRELSSSVLVEPDNDRTDLYENGTLTLKWVRKEKRLIIYRSWFFFRYIRKADDSSVYVCIATNEGGEAQEQLTIHVQGMIKQIRRILFWIIIWINCRNSLCVCVSSVDNLFISMECDINLCCYCGYSTSIVNMASTE